MRGVVASTYLQTRTGIVQIGEVVGQRVELWTGQQWAVTEPFAAGVTKSLVQVCLHDNSELECTASMRFEIVARKAKDAPRHPAGKERRKIVTAIEAARDVFPGYHGVVGILPPRMVLDMDLPNEPLAYEYGQYAANVLAVEPPSNLNTGLCAALKLGERLPRVIFRWGRSSIVRFLAGWADCRAENFRGRTFLACTSREQALSVQMLGTRAGIRVSLFKRDGDSTRGATRDYWLAIPDKNTELRKSYPYFAVLKFDHPRQALPTRRIGFPELSKRSDVFEHVKKVKRLPGVYEIFNVALPSCLFNNVLSVP